MRWLIVGAGGIGSTYGARLQAAGETVTLVARGEHLRALQERGLRVDHDGWRFDRPVDALDEERLFEERSLADVDVVVLAFKTQATRPWLARAGAWLQGGDAPILSLQNGVDNEPWIAEAVGVGRTLGGLAVRIGGHLEGPGEVRAAGEARVVMGVWPDAARGSADARLAARIADAFRASGVPCVASERIEVELWRKLLINVAVNPLTALTGLDTRAVTHDPSFGPAVEGAMREAAAVAVADGVPLTDRDVTEMLELIRGFTAIKTSMLVDREKGRPLELDGIAGAVLRRAERHGVAVPLTALIDGLLRWELGPDRVA